MPSPVGLTRCVFVRTRIGTASNRYYLRFIDPSNGQKLIDPEKEKYWMPVDLYVGGAEHAVLHLLYARFWHKVGLLA